MSRPAPAHLLAALLLLLRGGYVVGCSNVTSLSLALDTLLAEYDREGAPAQPARVLVAFDLRHAALRRDSTVHVLGDLTLSWLEPRISWNASEWGCDSALVSAERLWLPDVELLNSAGGGEQAALAARATSAGRVSWVLRLDAAVPLALDLHAWPSDHQTAVFKFGSRAQSYDEIELEVNEVEHVVLFESGEWELVSVSGALRTVGEQHVARYAAAMRRRAAAHEAAAGAVLAAAALLLLGAAMMPPLARAPLCACASFTAAVWLATALLRLPSSSTTPVSLWALCTLCAAGGATSAGAALVARAARCSSPPPRPLKAVASSLSALCRLAPLEDTSASAVTGAWAALATLLDYALLAALLLTLFIVLCVYL